MVDDQEYLNARVRNHGQALPMIPRARALNGSGGCDVNRILVELGWFYRKCSNLWLVLETFWWAYLL